MNFTQKLQKEIKLRRLSEQRPTGHEQLKEIRKQLKNFQIAKIENIEYRINDAVRYNVRFSNVSNPISMTRDQIKELRPRVYIRHLKETYEGKTFQVRRILGINGPDGKKSRQWLCKFHKYPVEDSARIKEEEVKAGIRALRALKEEDEQKKLFYKTQIKGVGPNKDLFNRMNYHYSC